MIRRALDPQFNTAVLEGRKTSTIRENPWPVGVPIMLYNWSGVAYRSKQIDVAAIRVLGAAQIKMTRFGDMDEPLYKSWLMSAVVPLWQMEGFESREAMAAWFIRSLKPNSSIVQYLMRFELLTEN